MFNVINCYQVASWCWKIYWVLSIILCCWQVEHPEAAVPRSTLVNNSPCCWVRALSPSQLWLAKSFCLLGYLLLLSWQMLSGGHQYAKQKFSHVVSFSLNLPACFFPGSFWLWYSNFSFCRWISKWYSPLLMSPHIFLPWATSLSTQSGWSGNLPQILPIRRIFLHCCHSVSC